MSTTGYFIGLDGGGTRTVAMLTDEKGQVKAFHRALSTNYHVVGEEQARATMFEIFDTLLAQADISRDDLKGVCLGLSGCDRPEDHKLVGGWLEKYGIRPVTYIVNDAVIALAGGADTGWGMLVISGTGSIYFARRPDGQTKRVGGWGPLLADEGSGYHLGREASRAIMRSFDGYEPETQLTPLILEALGLEKATDMVRWSTSEGVIKDRVAALSRHVFTAAEAGDPAAVDIIDRLTSLVAKMCATLAGLIDLGSDFDLVLAGGNFKHSDLYFSNAKKKILEKLPNVKISRPRMQPVAGAIIYAMTESGCKPDSAVMETLNATFPE